MTVNELLAGGLVRSGQMVKMLLADFSDADMLVRPAPGANHAAWQIGHLVAAETSILNSIQAGAAPALPAGWSERFAKEQAGSDDPAGLPGKAQLLAQFEATRAATVAWARGLSPDDLDKPGPERLRRLAPTLADVGTFIPVHTTMHLGQVSVIRRKLGKPVLF